LCPLVLVQFVVELVELLLKDRLELNELDVLVTVLLDKALELEVDDTSEEVEVEVDDTSEEVEVDDGMLEDVEGDEESHPTLT
jgi:hypothetical protein